jgi:thymidylate synthase
MGFMNKLDKQYQDLLQDILDNGVEKKDRTQTGTISVFGRQIRHKMSEGFPLLTTKKMPFKTIVTELLWFLRGDTNIKFLVDNNCHIWDGDAYKNYQLLMIGNEPEKILSMTDFIDKIKTDDKFTEKWGELGPIYGKQWRNWGRFEYEGFTQEGSETLNNIDVNWKIPTDQIQNLINDLKTNPDSRRLMVNAWNVGELDQMVLPPCHYGFQVYTRELSGNERWDLLEKKVGKELFDSWVSEIVPFGGGLSEYLQSHNIPKRAISLMWNQRSVDTFLGLPFNIASYGLLLEIIAKEVNMVPEELIGNLGDVHLYSNHIEQAKEQIGRKYTIEERVQLIPEGVLSQESVEYFNLNKRTNSEINVALAKYNISPGLHTREPYRLPTLVMVTNPDLKFDEYVYDNLKLVNYQSHPTIKAPLSN